MLKTIDWTKENVVLRMSSGTLRYPINCPKATNLSPNYVTVQQQWTPVLYCVDETPDYLSIRTYSIGYYPGVPVGKEPLDFAARMKLLQCSGSNTATYRLSDYRDGLAMNPNGFFILPSANNRSWYVHPSKVPSRFWNTHNAGEVRIYRDGKVAVLHHMQFPDGQEIQYMHPMLEGHGAHYAVPWATTPDGHCDIDTTLQAFPNVRIVTDAEAQEAAQRLTYKAMPEILHVIPNSSQDLRTRKIQYTNSYSTIPMAEETQKALIAFLECDAPENADRKAAWIKKGGMRKITYIFDLLLWLATPQKKKNVTVTKETMAKQFLSSVPELQQLWNDTTTDPETIYWARSNEAVIAILGKNPTRFRDINRIFAYDLKRKVRFYGEYSSVTGWNFPVPSAKALADSFSRAERVVLLNGLTPTQLFAGTNAGWLLDNARDIEVPDPFFEYTRGTTQQLVKLTSVMTSKRHSLWAMTALATSGQPLFEQLLKSGLSKFYSAALQATADGCLDNLFGKVTTSTYSWKSSHWAYDAKGKNLPQMLGVPMNMIREAEALTTYSLSTGFYRASRYELKMPYVRPLLEAMPTLPAADAATRQYWLGASIDYRGYGSNIVSIAKNVADKIDGSTPARLAQLAQKYGTDLVYLPDYRKAQAMLQDLQRQNPNLPGLFSNRLYPNMPGKAIRFIHYVPGTLDRPEFAWMSPSPMTPGRFLQKQYNIYNRENGDPDITPVYNETGELLGARIVMTPGNNLRYLHDDANYWVNFYGQLGKGDEFREAVRRMDSLTWRDPKLGLEIRAPRCVEELNQEGSVLAHSVASFADAIISGTTNVMFIRRIDMPEIPYYTVEIRPDGAIRQVHCYLNGGTSEEEQVKAYELSGLECYATPKKILRFLVNWGRAFPQNIDLCTLKREYDSYLA